MILRQILILLLLQAFELTLGQVQRNMTILQKELFQHSTVFNESRIRMNFEEMNDLTKLHLCIDVIQKTEKIKLMYRQYRTHEPNMKLPAFQIQYMKVRSTYKTHIPFIHKRTLNCPLNLIQFQGISYRSGSNFYVTESAPETCVLMLTPINTSPGEEQYLEIKAKVCELFLDINYDTTELEQEYTTSHHECGLLQPLFYLDYMETNSYIKNQIKWRKNMNQLKSQSLSHCSFAINEEILAMTNWMNNEQKFLLCLNVHGKVIRDHMFSLEYNTTEINNQLPEFAYVMAALSFVKIVQPTTEHFLWTLQCPMHKITFKKHNRLSGRTIPFYLAASIHDGCVYKLGSHYESDPDSPKHVHMYAEICGVLIPTRIDSRLLETEFQQKWSDLPPKAGHAYSRIPYLLPQMIRRPQTKFAENIYWKSELKYQKKVLVTNYSRCQLRIRRLQFNFIAANPVEVKTLKIPYQNTLISTTTSVIFVTDSVNLGCVYVMTGEPMYIRHEVCDPYPIRYFVGAKRKSVKPILEQE